MAEGTAMSNFFNLGARKAVASGLSVSKRAEEQKQHRPWVEKYRPKTVDEVSSQGYTVQVLKKALTLQNLPHMLFYGPPGTGKTSAILALCRQMFGPELMKQRVLELNASDERGISVVRDKIKSFAKSVVAPAPASAVKAGFPCPPFKIIVLDEADSMTQDAQSALRRIMENYSTVTRFCLVCNYVTRIIEPLTSRCSKFRFRLLDTGSARERIEHVAREENVKLDAGVVDQLLDCSEGDMRRAMMYLQSAARLRASDEDPVPAQAVTEVAGVVPDRVILRLLSAARVPLAPTDAEARDEAGARGQDADGDAAMPDVDAQAEEEARRLGVFDAVQRSVAAVVREGYAATQVLSQLHAYLVLHPTLSSKFKAQASLAMGSTDKALTEGGDEELHLLDLVLVLAHLGKIEQA